MDLKSWALTLLGILFSGAFIVFAQMWRARNESSRKINELEYKKEKADARTKNSSEPISGIIDRIRKRLGGDR